MRIIKITALVSSAMSRPPRMTGRVSIGEIIVDDLEDCDMWEWVSIISSPTSLDAKRRFLSLRRHVSDGKRNVARVADQIDYLLHDGRPKMIDSKFCRFVLKPKVPDQLLCRLASALPSNPWNAGCIKSFAESWAENPNHCISNLRFWLEVVICGTHSSPDVFVIMEVLGHEEVLNRLCTDRVV